MTYHCVHLSTKGEETLGGGRETNERPFVQVGGEKARGEADVPHECMVVNGGASGGGTHLRLLVHV